MRIKHKINVQVFDDADGKNKLFAPDDALAEVILDGFTRYTSGRFSVAPETTESLAMGDLTTIRGFWIQADNDCNLTINGGDPIALKVGKAGGTAKAAIECTVTSLSVEAPDEGVTVTGIYLVYGEPAD
jgi:hypothetical protein